MISEGYLMYILRILLIIVIIYGKIFFGDLISDFTWERDSMFCPNCGNQCPDGTKFCQSCGTPLTNNQQQNTQPDFNNQQANYQQPNYQQPNQQYQQPNYNQYQ